MHRAEREHSWSEFLDREGNNILLVKFLFREDFSGVEEFTVIYLIAVGGKIKEVVKYDCSEKEAVHVHKLFGGKKEKKYLEKEKGFGTLEEFVQDIRKNWRLYRARFMEGTPGRNNYIT